MKIILARHGRTEWNAKRLIQGYADIPLDAEGVEQAHRLGSRLIDRERRTIPLILSSDLLRARQTAAIVQRYAAAPIVYDARLREASFGTLEGMTYEQFDAACGERNLREHPNVLEYDFTPFGGESAEAVLARIRQALDAVAMPDERSEALVVGHGRSHRTLYYALKGVNQHFDNCAHFDVDYPTP